MPQIMYECPGTTDVYSFPTVDLVQKMVFSPIGKYLACLEGGPGPDASNHVRVYINWWNQQSVQQPMRARVAAVSPGNNKDDLSFEMIEIGCKPDSTNISVCPATGNLLVVSGSNLTIYKYTLASQHASKIKYIDFQECVTIVLNYEPKEVCIAEDVIACLTASMAHVFKVKVEEATEESVAAMRSLSMYSFSSDSDASMDYSPTKSVQPSCASVFTNPAFKNVTERRRVDSSSEREIASSVITKHPDHMFLRRKLSEGEEDSVTGNGGSSVYHGLDLVPNPLVDREEGRDLGSLSS